MPEVDLSSRSAESSMFTFFRISVILACVVGIPFLAIFWNGLPEIEFQSWYDKAMTAFASKNEPPTVYRAEPTGHHPSDPYSPDPYSPDPQSIDPYSPDLLNDFSALVPATTSLPLPDVSVVSPSSSSTAFHQSPISQASFAGAVPSVPVADPYFAANPAPLTEETELQRQQARLGMEFKRLGAQFFRLQTWGNHGELYRFSCYVSAPRNDQYQKHFQAIDADSVQAMRRVLDEVKTWRAGML